jgi:hypothetical protein
MYNDKAPVPLPLALKLLETGEWKNIIPFVGFMSGTIAAYSRKGSPAGRTIEASNLFSNFPYKLVFDGVPEQAEIKIEKKPYTVNPRTVKDVRLVFSVDLFKLDADGNVVLEKEKPVPQYNVQFGFEQVVFTPVNEKVVRVRAMDEGGLSSPEVLFDNPVGRNVSIDFSSGPYAGPVPVYFHKGPVMDGAHLAVGYSKDKFNILTLEVDLKP